MSSSDFDLIESELGAHLTAGRTNSAALLAWFLNTVWRLDLTDVDDAICDGGGDKGIDALVVDDDLQEITLFQSKHRARADATQGDLDLRTLVGAAAYFESPEAVDGLLRSKPNAELRRLLLRSTVRDKVANGSHVARTVLVTNGRLDPAGRDYVNAMEGRSPSLEAWDCDHLAAVAARTRRPDLRPESITLVSVAAPTVAELGAGTRIAVGLVSAAQLIALPGIDDLTLFGRNVRLGVGRTRINRELDATVCDQAEHALFPAYHNGLTLLTGKLDTVGSELRLHGVGVVNGCQSLLALHANRSHVSRALNLLVKVVQVDPQSDLADTITYRTNNQNSVDIRDQRSTDIIQRDLQAQVREAYGTELGYAIRAGERPGGRETLDNQTAAQLLMAVYVNEPWNAVRKVRLFDQDYHRIFNRTVDSHKLFLIHQISKLIDGVRPRLRPELRASFASIRLTIAYLVAQVLRESDAGRGVLAQPERWLPDILGPVRSAMETLIDDVVESVNFYVQEEETEDADFDPKIAFKSQSGVRAIETEVLKSSRRQAKRDASFLFNVEPVR